MEQITFTPRQQIIIQIWDDWNAEHGINPFLEVRPFLGDTLVVLERFIFTVGISIYIDENFRLTRFCYPNLVDALGALNDWQENKFDGKPQGYIKQKPEDD